MQARYYDPVIGRFYSNDPVGAVSNLNTQNGIHGFNRYAYANNNPYKYTDPDGEATALAAGIGGTVVCGPICGGIAFVATAIATGYVLSEVASDESPGGDVVDGIKEGKSPAKGEAGAKGQLEETGGQDGAKGDLGSLPIKEGTEWSNGNSQGGTLDDGSGRKVNVHPSGGGDSHPKGTPTLEVQKPNGKPEVKIRYPESQSNE
jgi:uncharacterized protein RhaS with RHS repeats